MLVPEACSFSAAAGCAAALCSWWRHSARPAGRQISQDQTQSPAGPPSPAADWNVPAAGHCPSADAKRTQTENTWSLIFSNFCSGTPSLNVPPCWPKSMMFTVQMSSRLGVVRGCYGNYDKPYYHRPYSELEPTEWLWDHSMLWRKPPVGSQEIKKYSTWAQS